MAQTIRDMFLVSKITAFELVAVKSHCYEQNSCHGQLLCYQTVLRFQTSVRAIFSNTTSTRVMEKVDKSAVVKT